MPYVHSTLTRSTDFVERVGDSATIGRKVTIHGGANCPNINLATPRGIATKVTDDELEFLLKNHEFKNFVKSGFISYDQKQADPEKAADSLKPKDGAAPLTDGEGDRLANKEAEVLGDGATVKIGKVKAAK